MDKFTSILDQIAATVDKADVNVVFGEPKEVQGRTLIPVAEVAYGFGMGLGAASVECGDAACVDHDDDACCSDEEECAGADDEGEFGGGAAGARVRPLAYIEVGADSARVIPIQDEQKIALMGIALGMWCVAWLGLVLKSLFKK
ncbi:MAG: hypothetical protein JW892_09075 [Anaerolineae bacterium]|nr:hypothetical protein [Anaerolineae bacterium]